jgi:uncharacterized protein with HEPN domain
MDAESFMQSEVVRDAVERNLITIGEAARAVPEDIVIRHPELPWADMRGFRNVLVHEYFGISAPRLWETIEIDLPHLVGPLTAILRAEG